MIKRLRGRDGFTLVEVMAAMAILSIGLLGLAAMFLNSIRADQTASLRFMATDIMTSEIEEIKLLGYVNLTWSNLTMAPFNYKDKYAALDDKYEFIGNNTNAASGYDWVNFKGVNKKIQKKGQAFGYLYTLKLSGDNDYLATPTLRRLRMEIFWMHEGRLTNSNLVFMVGRQ